ncbi:MAG: hypothetical protein ACRC2T_07655 [Thermoguttaceae bacterium]
MNCSICKTNEFPLVTLWNGKDYCRCCLEKTVPGLYDYAKNRPRFISDFSQWQQYYSARRAYFLLGIACLSLPALVIFYVLVSPPQPLCYSDGTVFWFCLQVPPLMYVALFLCVSVYHFFNLRSMIARHPKIEIENNTVTLTHPRGKFWWKYLLSPNTKTVPLSNLSVTEKTIENDLHFHTLFTWRCVKKVQMLDFTGSAEEAFQGRNTDLYPFPLNCKRWIEAGEQKNWFCFPFLVYSFNDEDQKYFTQFFINYVVNIPRKTS